MIMEHWWDDIGRENPKNSVKVLSHFYVVCHKFQISAVRFGKLSR